MYLGSSDRGNAAESTLHCQGYTANLVAGEASCGCTSQGVSAVWSYGSNAARVLADLVDSQSSEAALKAQEQQW